MEASEMSGFEASGWSQAEYAAQYRDEVDHYIPQRATMLRVVSSFHHSLVRGAAKIRRTGKVRVLDLGCGDGILAEVLCVVDPEIEVTVTDGSCDMLEAAQARLSGRPVSEFSQITFEAIIAGAFQREPFDLIASAFAIHHLELAQKAMLFQRLYALLVPGAYFLNVDVALSDVPAYTEWYYHLWREWIIDRETVLGAEQTYAHVPEEARAKPENHYDSLQDQLEGLRSAGYSSVACHYRYGPFAVYGGRRPEEPSRPT
jgi:tRNA (cmo5U34)-methyltransferase